MGQNDPLTEARRFGKFLREVRERRRLSLDVVEEMATAYPDRVTKSHLSRIENGLAEPSFRKLFALSQIYGMPLVTLAEQFEIDLKRELTPVDLEGRSQEEIETEAKKLMQSGRYSEALLMLVATLDRLRGDGGSRLTGHEKANWTRHFRLGVVNCLVHLRRWESAKLETEQLLSDEALSVEQRLMALQFFVAACYSLKRYTVAMMGLERAEKELSSPEASPRMAADFAVLRGNLLQITGGNEEAVQAYTRALRIYEELPNPFEACRTRINMAAAMLPLGEHDHARQQLEAALLVAEASGYDRQRALAMSHMAILAFECEDFDAAESWAIRSNSIARSREFMSLVFRNCYYLWRIAGTRGDDAALRANERTMRSLQSRVEDYLPEVEAFRKILTGGES